ncbi:MAG: hypothetical protein AMXMBFR7_33230 [Planctomycetota bacterium]
MRWSRSQEALFDLAREPIKGVPLDVVVVHEWRTGVSTALKFLERQSLRDQKIPRSVLLDGAGAWDAVVSLSRTAGPNLSGLGYFDRMERAFRSLSGEERRPLCLWLDEARLMRPSRRELFAAHVDYTAGFLHIPVRIVMVIGKVMIFDSYKQRRVEAFPPLGDRLLGRARSWDFKKSEFGESEEPVFEPAVASA